MDPIRASPASDNVHWTAFKYLKFFGVGFMSITPKNSYVFAFLIKMSSFILKKFPLLCINNI